MPARQMPTRNLKTAALAKPCEKNAKQALNQAPEHALTTKILLAGKPSANPLRAKLMVPRMKPSCTALVSKPIPEMLMPQARMRSGAALLALNHSDVPNNCAIAITATGLDRTISTAPFPLGNATANLTSRGGERSFPGASIPRSASSLASSRNFIVCLALCVENDHQQFVQCRDL